MIDVTVLSSGSHGNCYLVDDGQSKLLLDAGIRFRDIRQGLGYQVTSLAGVLVTHEHGDHIRAVPDLLRAGVDVFASAGTWRESGIARTHRGRVIEAHSGIAVGSWVVLPFEAIHDAAEPLSFLLASQATGAKLLFVTDSAYVRYRFAGLTEIMIEANYSSEILHQQVAAGELHPSQAQRVIRNHMSIERAVEMLRANDLSRVEGIWLLHLSDRTSHAEQFRRLVQEATGRPTYIAERGR